MTAGKTRQSWDELYRTALFYIMREHPGTATPYRLGKTKTGYESCSFEVKDDKGRVTRKYVLLKAPGGTAIALSVVMGDPKDDAANAATFERMVSTAKIIEAS